MSKPRNFPIMQSRLGLSIGQAEAQSGIPAKTLRRLIDDGHVTLAADGSIPNAEIARARRDRPELLVD